MNKQEWKKLTRDEKREQICKKLPSFINIKIDGFYKGKGYVSNGVLEKIGEELGIITGGIINE